ncbi:MAG: serine/threonine-protein kinase [Polyangiaceae bacterium]
MTDSTDAPVSSTLGAGQAPASTELYGPVIGGKYRVEQLLGRGGMGVVLAARHEILGEPVAIKFLASATAKDAKATERFVREAKAALKIKGEHVVRVLDVGTHEGKPYLVMERLEGTDLGSLLASEGPLPIADAVRYVLQACEALAEAHAQGIVHRDLKPSNLFLTQRPDGTPLVKVLDFGIAKASADSEASGSNPSLTDTHAVFGSPSYMSPEQIRSAKHVDARADVWAIGVVLFELLAGRLPFLGESTGAVLASVIADEPPALRSLRADVPEGLARAVARCIEKDLTKRMPSVADLADAIAPYAPQGTTSSERIRRLSGRPPAPAASSQSAIVITSSPTSTGDDKTVDVTSAPSSSRVSRVVWGALLLAGAYRPRPSVAARRTPAHVDRVLGYERASKRKRARHDKRYGRTQAAIDGGTPSPRPRPHRRSEDDRRPELGAGRVRTYEEHARRTSGSASDRGRNGGAAHGDTPAATPSALLVITPPPPPTPERPSGRAHTASSSAEAERVMDVAKGAKKK